MKGAPFHLNKTPLIQVFLYYARHLHCSFFFSILALASSLVVVAQTGKLRQQCAGAPSSTLLLVV